MSIQQPTSLVVGTRVHDRYTILAVVGRGGLGTVYKVSDDMLPQTHVFALKETADLSEGAREQFERETRWLQQLEHPNIPRVLHSFEWQDRLYLVMDFVSGENLEHKLMRNGDRPLPETEVLAWIRPICDALAYLHAQKPQIIHRDVKPANIIVTPDGRPALVDLGIAKELLPGGRNLTATFIRKAGTEGYAPPEQYISNGATDPRSDIYSLGATMYHLLTGTVPASAVERAALDGQLIAPRAINPVISIGTEAVVMHALAIRPVDRFQTMRDMQQALSEEAFATTAPAVVPQVSTQPHCPRCGRPMATLAPICNVCATELAMRAEGKLAPLPQEPARGAFTVPTVLMQSPVSAPSQMANPLIQGPISMHFTPTPVPPSSSRRAIERPKGERQPRSGGRHQSTARAQGRQSDGATPAVGRGSGITAKRRSPWRIALVLVVLVLLGSAVTVGTRYFLMPSIDESSPQSSANGYFNALKTHNYTQAYAYYSAKGSTSISFSEFQREQEDENAQFGDINKVSMVQTAPGNDASHMTVSMAITRLNVSTPTDYTINLAEYAGKWLIDSVISG